MVVWSVHQKNVTSVNSLNGHNGLNVQASAAVLANVTEICTVNSAMKRGYKRRSRKVLAKTVHARSTTLCTK